MSVVVSQTLPFSATELQLENPNRWSRLLPLIRPSIKSIELRNGQTAMIDTALGRSDFVLIAVISSVGNFPSRILTKSGLAVFTLEQGKNSNVNAEDVIGVLKEQSFPIVNGVVIVTTGSWQNIRIVSPSTLEVTVRDELQLDHLLSLMFASSSETKTSFDKTKVMLEHFVKAATTISSTFLEKKIRNGPAVAHSTEVSEFTSAKAAIDQTLGLLLGSQPLSKTGVVYSVHYADINGLSRLENNILAHEIADYLVRKDLPSFVTHSSILKKEARARGWALSLCVMLTTFLSPQIRPSNTLSASPSAESSTRTRAYRSKFPLADAQVRKMVTAGCENVIKHEPTITEYDTIVGDGDCGYTLRDGAKQVLKFIADPDLSQLPSTLSDLVDDLEVNMGGTSGALYCIFLSSLALNLRDAPSFPDALRSSLDDLLNYTRARLGDRTCLDCLIPFVETLEETGDVKKALAEAQKGVESTKKLEAKLGRSSYLSETATRGVPDPGAYGLLKLLEGMVGARE